MADVRETVPCLMLMDESLKRILESKAAYRRELARKPVAEKLRIVEQMAERTRAIRQSRERGKPAARWRGSEK